MKYYTQIFTQRTRVCRLSIAALILLCLLFFGSSGLCQKELAPPDINVSGLKPAAPSPNAASLKPGLAVFYVLKLFRNIDEMPPMDRARKIGRPVGRPGAPVLQLNHQFDKGVVFDSGQTRGVGVYMNGYIRFSRPGRYIITAQSNDGIRIFIDNQMIINDPDVHGDRYSNRGIFEIKEPGWYDIAMQYFQRKGTAMLKLYWQVPGSNDRVIVPAEVFAHR
jgi:hypothetical protein